MTRLLVVDGSELMTWLVEQIAGTDVEVVRASSYEEAQRIIDTDTPDGAILNVAPCRRHWRCLVERCRRHDPPVPFLCCATVEDEIEEAERIGWDHVLIKPFAAMMLRERIETLLEDVREQAEATRQAGEPEPAVGA